MDNMTADAVISRAGTESVVFFNDAHDWTDGKPRDVRLVVYENAAMPSDFSSGWGDPTCNISLDASQFSDVQNISPSLSPDGTKVLWGDDQGIEVASLGDPSNCASITPRLLIAGGSQPFYAKGNEQPGATDPTQPAGTLPGPTPGPTPGPLPTPPHPKVTRPANTKKPRVTRSGRTLTCNRGTWSNRPTRYQYRWTVNGKTTRAAGGSRLIVNRKLRRHQVRCSVTASNAAGRTSATSSPFRVR